MPSQITEVVIILLLILLNGVFAMSEIAVVSARKARLQQRAETGDLKARAALELAEEPNQFLSTVQIGITLVGIFAGAFGGARLSGTLAEALGNVPLLAPYASALALGLVVAGIAYLSLVLGELVPKRLGLSNPERVAAAVAGPMRVLSRIASPLVTVLSVSTEGVLRVLGLRPSDEPPVTEEEVRLLIRQGTRAGVFEEEERELVERVFRLADRRVRGLMTPRGEVYWLDLEDSQAEILAKLGRSPYSRLPVGSGSLDQLAGLVFVKELLPKCLEGQPFDLPAALHKPLMVPGSMPALRVLEKFKQSGMEIALVVDEYGGTQGLVTVTDIMEAIVGDLPALGEQEEPEVLRREDGSWLLDGMLPVDELKEVLELRSLPGEGDADYHTLGGLVMTQLGRIPVTGDTFDLAPYRFEVMDMDGNRVDKVLAISQTPPDERESQAG